MKHHARKRFGQNFLHDESVIARIIASLKPASGDTVIEVGPGLGALTLPLLEHVDHLQVVEIDRDLIARLAALQRSNLQIHEGDVLDMQWQTLSTGKPLRIVGNLPYNIGTPLLIELLNVHPLVRDIHVMLQKEVVDRLHAASGTRAYGRLSVMMQSVFDITPLFTVPPESFDPMPKVHSAVVRLKTRDDALSAEQLSSLQQTTRLAFAAKRKTLRNNFKGHLNEQQLQAIEIDPQARAETLSLDDFIRLAKALVSCNRQT